MGEVDSSGGSGLSVVRARESKQGRQAAGRQAKCIS